MYAILLLILFPILYKNNRTWYFIYSMLFFVIGRFIAFKLELSYAIIIHNIFYLGVLIPFVFDNTYRNYFLPLTYWVLIYVAYLYFLHTIHGNEFLSDLKDNFRVSFVFVFAVEVFESLKRDKIDLSYFGKAFKVILFCEIVLCWMQYFFHDFGNFFRITEFNWRGEDMSMTGNNNDILDSNLCIGTLMKASTFANYIAYSLTALFLAKRKVGFKRNDYFLLAFSILTLLITGIRAPFLVFILMVFLLLMKGMNALQKITLLVAGLFAVVVLLPILSGLGSQGGLNSLDNSVLRTLNVFTQLETGSFSEESTFTWPLSMIPYIVEHPLFGNGLHYGSGYFMALNFHILEDLSLSDAGIFFYWAEYGLIGLFIFFFFYYYLVKISPSFGFDKSDFLLMVLLLFLLSIVDCSVLDHNCTTVFALLPIVLAYYQCPNFVKE